MPDTATVNPSPATSAEDFAQVLRAELDALGSFVSVLQAEQEILVQGDADRLAELMPDKSYKIELLTFLGQQRKRHLTSQDLTDSADGMLTWLRRNPGFAAAVRKIWKDLLSKAETARQLNESNGLLIETGLQQNHMKLAVLRNASASEGVYRADGRFGHLNNSRSFIQA